MDLNPSHTRVSGYGTVYRMNYDGVTTLGNFVDCSDAGTVPCVDARLVDKLKKLMVIPLYTVIINFIFDDFLI